MLSRAVSFLAFCIIFIAAKSSHAQLWNKVYPNAPAIGYYPIDPGSLGTYIRAVSWDYRYGGLLGFDIQDLPNRWRDHTCLIRLNAQGDTVWTKAFPFANGCLWEQYQSISRLSNGCYVIAAGCGDTSSAGYTDQRTLRIDASGNIKSNKIHFQDGGGAGSAYLKVASADNGGYYAVRRRGYYQPGHNTVASWDSIVSTLGIQKFDSTDALVADDSFQVKHISLYQTYSGSCFWYNRLRAGLGNFDVQPCTDGGLFLIFGWDTSLAFSSASCAAFRKPGSRAGDAFVTKYNSQLQKQWSIDLPLAMNLPGYKLPEVGSSFPTSDSGILISGRITDTSARVIYGYFVNKLNKYGQVTDTLFLSNNTRLMSCVEAPNGGYLFLTRVFNVDGITRFDRQLKFSRFIPLPVNDRSAENTWFLSPNQYGGVFATYVADTSVSPFTKPLINWLAASFNMDSIGNAFPASITGKLVLDQNKNCSYEASADRQMAYKPVSLTSTATSKTYLAYTNDRGDYVSNVPTGTYRLSHIPDANKALECLPAGYRSINISLPGTAGGYDLFDTLTPARQDMKVLMSAGLFVRGFTSPLELFVMNNGGTTSTDTLRLIKPSWLSVVSTSPAAGAISGDTLLWPLNSIGPDSIGHFNVLFSTPALAPLGSMMAIYASINSAGDATPMDNYDTVNRYVVGAYDPNTKTVNRPLYTTARRDWVYRIDFQNIGNYPAKDVVISDRFEPKFDLSTFRVLSSSHGIPKIIQQENGRLLFRYDDIYLADSVHNEPASHGWITYAVSPSSLALTGDTLCNSAAIIFDFNDLVMTDTTVNILTEAVASLRAAGMALPQPGVTIYPNPTTGMLAILSDISGEALLLDMQGRRLAQFHIVKGKSYVQLPQELGSGVYILRGRADNGTWLGTTSITLTR